MSEGGDYCALFVPVAWQRVLFDPFGREAKGLFAIEDELCEIRCQVSQCDEVLYAAGGRAVCFGHLR